MQCPRRSTSASAGCALRGRPALRGVGAFFGLAAISGLLAALFATASAAHAQASEEPIQWSRASGGNGHWYQRVTTPESIHWSAAEAAARAAGGRLVTIESQEEQAWVVANLVVGLPVCPSEVGRPDRAIWIGLRQNPDSPSYSEPSGGWEWITGGVPSYLNWFVDRPDDVPAGAGLAGMSVNGQWDDLTDDAGEDCFIGYVIEWSDDCDANGVVDFGELSSATDTDDDGALDACERAYGDLDLDGSVDALDLAGLLAAWGGCPTDGPCVGDFDGDGIVGALDLAFLLAVWGESPPWAAPVVTSISPNVGPEAGGTTITVTGVRLSSASSVTVGGAEATGVVVVNDGTVTAVTPAGTGGPKAVAVTTPRGTSLLPNAFSYTVPAPTITSVSPSLGSVAGGTAITITGTDLAGTTSVTVGGVPATAVTVVNAATVTAITPAGTAGAKAVALTTPGGTATLNDAFTYAAGPYVQSVSPAVGPLAGGTFVTIAGFGFDTPATVRVGGATAAIAIVTSPTTIIAITPPGGAGPCAVEVDVPAGSALLPSAFTYLEAPMVGGVAPAAGPSAGGTAITVIGSNFHAPASVRVGGNLATSVMVLSPTTLTAVTPAGTAGSAAIAVTTPGGSGTRSGAFTYWASPTITSVSPTLGPTTGGNAISLFGTNFYGASSGLSVTIGGVSATATIVHPTQIIAIAPPGDPGLSAVSVTTPSGSATLASGYTYVPAVPPTIATVTPSTGLSTGGTAITITGANFHPGSSNAVVRVGGAVASSVVVVNATTITAVTPPGAAGAAGIEVSTSSGTAVADGAFTYQEAPIIASVLPQQGPSSGGTNVLILGSGFIAPLTVRFGGTASTAVEVLGPTALVAVTPPGGAGPTSVSVTTSVGTATALAAFTFLTPPSIATVVPAAGPIEGGLSITINGTNLLGTTAVQIGGVAATNVTILSASAVRVSLPPGVVGQVDVTLSTPGGNAIREDGFRYFVPGYDVLEHDPDPTVVYDPNLREAIVATGLPWRVRDNATQIEMVLIPPGTFDMGCSRSDQFDCGAENPVHSVTLTNAFYLGRYEVTQAQWVAQMGWNPSWFQSASAQVSGPQVASRPVEQVSWNAIAGSGGFLSGTGLRLPTEAEWEYAYRAGTTTAFHGWPAQPNGTNDDTQVGNIAWFTSNSSSQTRPVGQKAGNGFGLHDMSGNASEWVNDWWSTTYYDASPSTNPPGPSSGTNRVFRGGSWAGTGVNHRASGRNGYGPGFGYDFVGFRVARSP